MGNNNNNMMASNTTQDRFSEDVVSRYASAPVVARTKSWFTTPRSPRHSEEHRALDCQFPAGLVHTNYPESQQCPRHRCPLSYCYCNGYEEAGSPAHSRSEAGASAAALLCPVRLRYKTTGIAMRAPMD